MAKRATTIQRNMLAEQKRIEYREKVFKYIMDYPHSDMIEIDKICSKETRGQFVDCLKVFNNLNLGKTHPNRRIIGFDTDVKYLTIMDAVDSGLKWPEIKDKYRDC